MSTSPTRVGGNEGEVGEVDGRRKVDEDGNEDVDEDREIEDDERVWTRSVRKVRSCNSML